MRTVHWTAALCFSLAVHLGLAGIYLSEDKTALNVPQLEGGDGIEIGLDPGAITADEEVPEQSPPEQPVAAEPPPPEPEPTPEPAPPKPEEPQPTPELETVEAPAETENLVAKVDKDPASNLPEQPPATEQSPAKEALSSALPPQASTSNQANSRPTQTKSGKTGKGGKPGAANGYLGDLMGWLRKHKKYPPELKKKKQQGVVEVKFSIDRNGELLSSAIHKTSGNPLLDEAALQMLAAASPMPSIPEALDRDTLTLVIPVEYSLITH